MLDYHGTELGNKNLSGDPKIHNNYVTVASKTE
jgi:hypothetical protein